jgi:hypothetical protein
MMTDRDLANTETNCKISGGEGESGDVGIDDGRERVSMPMSQEDRGNKNPYPRELSGGCSQGERLIRGNHVDISSFFASAGSTEAS